MIHYTNEFSRPNERIHFKPKKFGKSKFCAFPANTRISDDSVTGEFLNDSNRLGNTCELTFFFLIIGKIRPPTDKLCSKVLPLYY